MSKHEPRISGNEENGFYALIVRIDYDGQENVIYGYARHFASRKNAERSVNSYMKKHGMIK